MVIADEPATRDARQLMRLIEQHQVKVLQATPSTWRMLVPELKGQSSPEIEHLTALCGGEPLDLALATSLLDAGVELWNVYGPTETTIWSGARCLGRSDLADGFVPIGNPLHNTLLTVLDDKLRPVPLGAAGELCIGGAGLSPGYHNRPEQTADRFVDVQHTSDSTALRLYRTGDCVRVHVDGRIEFVGRLDHQIKLRGHRIELGEIETALQAFPEVLQAVVVVQQHGGDNQRLVAFVKPRENATVDPSQIRDSLRRRLPEYMVPAVVTAIDEFPMTPNGKTDRRKLQEVEAQPASAGGAPATRLESQLANIWKEVLGVERVGTRDNFFDMGGHSLLLLNAQGKLKEQLDIDLPLVDFFRFPTLESLATHLERTSRIDPAESRQQQLAQGKSRLAQRRKKIRSGHE
ncbi:MAG: non-ribosomal peptide synthetase [Planctomycetota bacterium]